MASLLNRIKGALGSPVQLWAALFIATGAVLIVWLGVWKFAESGDRNNVQRWSKGGGLQEADGFASKANYAHDSGQWQSKVKPAASNRSSERPDYAFSRVSVYSVPNIHPPRPYPTLKDLGDRAQVSAIEAIEHKAHAHPWDDLRRALSDQDEPGAKDPFLFERVLVATVEKGTKWPPGDRMVWTRIFVHPINFKFAAYTIAATDNETVKVSSVEATDVRKLSADIGLTIPGVSPKLGLTGDHESTVKSTSDISTQYERLGVDITPSLLRIIRESAAGGDVAGNTRVAISLTTDPVQILKGVKNADDPRLQDPEITLVVTGVHLSEGDEDPSIEVLPLVPLPHCALRAEVWMLYEQRHIQQHRELYDESQQTVVFFHDVDESRPVEMMGADDVSPFVWSIQIVPKNEKPDNKWNKRSALNARFGEGGTWRQLVFSDYGRAASLAHWLRTHPKDNLSGYQFKYDPNQGLAVIKQTTDDCNDEVLRPAPVDHDQTRSGQ